MTQFPRAMTLSLPKCRGPVFAASPRRQSFFSARLPHSFKSGTASLASASWTPTPSELSSLSQEEVFTITSLVVSGNKAPVKGAASIYDITSGSMPVDGVRRSRCRSRTTETPGAATRSRSRSGTPRARCGSPATGTARRRPSSCWEGVTLRSIDARVLTALKSNRTSGSSAPAARSGRRFRFGHARRGN